MENNRLCFGVLKPPASNTQSLAVQTEDKNGESIEVLDRILHMYSYNYELDIDVNLLKEERRN